MDKKKNIIYLKPQIFIFFSEALPRSNFDQTYFEPLAVEYYSKIKQK